MNKELSPLEALEYFRLYLVKDYADIEPFETIENTLNEKEKQDEILRIIKEKRVCIKALLLSSNAKEYNTYCDLNNLASELTQAEFDLLKEWLK